MKRLIAAALMLSLAACAGPITMSPQGSNADIQRERDLESELVYKKYIQDQDRVFNIAFPILTANQSFCGNHTSPHYGMTAWNIYTVGPNYRRAAQNIYNLQERVATQYIADGSPADRAGIRSGDFIVAVNGQQIPPGKDGIRIADQALDRAGYDTSAIVLERDGRRINTRLTPARGCDYPVVLDYNSSEINAFADGRRIVISKGIVRFAEDDNELALVIAHELGHNTLDHVGKQQQNAMVGSLGGLAIDSILTAAGVSTGSQFSRMGGQLGAQQYSVAFEQEADYVGMYFMERAGYNSAHVADFWRRMAAENPNSVFTRTSHPTSPERFLAIENTHQEIANKRSRGMALAPNLRQQ